MATALELALDWRKARAERLAADKISEGLKEIETELKTKLMERLRKAANKSVSNGDRLIQLVTKDEPVVQKENWPLVWAHIKKTQDLDLLERRINKTAVKERWEDGKVIPGVSKLPVETISDTAAK
jgi:hypothetical protein